MGNISSNSSPILHRTVMSSTDSCVTNLEKIEYISPEMFLLMMGKLKYLIYLSYIDISSVSCLSYLLNVTLMTEQRSICLFAHEKII